MTVDYLEASEKVKNKMKLWLADGLVNVLEIFDEYLKDKFKKKLKTLIRKSIKNEINNEIPAFKEQINNIMFLNSKTKQLNTSFKREAVPAIINERCGEHRRAKKPSQINCYNVAIQI